MTPTRRGTCTLLVCGLLLSVGTPTYLGLARPGLAIYLLHPAIVVAQSLPYLVAASLWLPWRSPPAGRLGQWLARVLLLATAALYIPMLIGWWSTGGDMVGLAFFMIAAGLVVSILLATLVTYTALWLRARRPRP